MPNPKIQINSNIQFSKSLTGRMGILEIDF
jgi:hypothetical protein